MDKQGLLFCTRYAISPNFFGYCGPAENTSLIDHLHEGTADKELYHHLCDFETMYPYLQLIARKNKISDPFDRRVVEAYWLGNSFLNPVTAIEYQAFAKEKLFLDKKLPAGSFSNLQFRIANFKFYPHHAFHVFNIFKRTGNDFSFHTLETMDNCRIGWGRIIKNSKFKIQNNNSKFKINSISIETKQLIFKNNCLMLTNKIVKELKIEYRGRSFLNNLKVGGWVSFHWGFVCDVLTERQVKNLEFYTQKAIDFYNL